MTRADWSTGLAALVAAAWFSGAARGEELTCLLAPKDVVAVASPIEGIIQKVLVDRGDDVQAGETIALLNSDVQQSTLDRAVAHAGADSAVKLKTAELAQNQAKLARDETAYSKNLISSQDLEDQRFATEIAQQGLGAAEEDLHDAALDAKIAEAQLDQTKVVSPIDGVVLQRLVSAGEYSTTQTTVMRIAQLDPLYVEVALPAESFGSVGKGMRASLTIGPGNLGAAATVIVVDPVIDAASRSFGVRLLLDNPGDRIPAGLTCHIVRWLPAN